MSTSVTSPGVKRSQLWFGLLGGAIAWLLHLIVASIISEWGCTAGLYRREIFGITMVTWMLIAISILMLLLALLATWSAHRVNRHYREAAEQEPGFIEPDSHGTDVFMAQTGLWSSWLFVFIIAAQCVPIFFFLKEC
jgi:hypothetical protein